MTTVRIMHADFATHVCIREQFGSQSASVTHTYLILCTLTLINAIINRAFQYNNAIPNISGVVHVKTLNGLLAYCIMKWTRLKELVWLFASVYDICFVDSINPQSHSEVVWTT